MSRTYPSGTSPKWGEEDDARAGGPVDRRRGPGYKEGEGPSSVKSPEPRPNLFLVGAMKCGTSSIYATLRAHPQVFASPVKEPAWFAEPSELERDSPGIAQRRRALGERGYFELFRGAGGRPIVAEGSTAYTKLRRITGVPDRIARFNPEARILYAMRDPVRRTVSHYLHHVRQGYERRDAWTAIARDPIYTDVSHYAMQLEPYLRLFGPDRVRAVTLEAWAARPAEVFAETCRFLGIDDRIAAPPLARWNVTPSRNPRLPKAFRRFLRSRFWRLLRPLVPQRIRSLARSVTEVDASLETAMTPRLVEHLRRIQREQTQELEERLGRRFDEWRLLHGTAAAGWRP